MSIPYLASKSTHTHSPLGICQALASNCALSHVIPIKFGGLRAQAHFDVPQTRPISELGERHASISIRACECFYVIVAVIPGDTLIENGPWQMLHDLGKTRRPENITSSLLVVISDSGMWKSVQREFKLI